MRHPESILQTQCVNWFRWQYPGYALDLWAIPNGGKRSKVEAAIMQGEGVTPGVPDLFLAVPTFETAGLFIEMKYGSNTPSEKQKAMHERLKSRGYHVAVCWSLDEFITVIQAYFKLPRR